MLSSFSVALFLYSKNRSYDKLVTLSQGTHDGTSAMSSVYTSPTPTMSDYQDQIDLVKAKINAWNNGRGSKNSLDQLKTEAKVLRGMCKQLGEYVMATVPDQPQSWRDAGFEVKAEASASVLFDAVQNFRRLVRAVLPLGAIKLKWARPLNSGRRKVSSYRVMRGTTSDFTQATELGFTTKNYYVDYPPTGQTYYYWTIAYSTIGAGATPDPVVIEW